MEFKIKETGGTFIDIGASYWGSSPTPSTAMLGSGKQSLLIECDESKYQNLISATDNIKNISISNERANPDNIVSMLEANLALADGNIDILKVDIDGYDYYVLDSILQKYKPNVINCEFNEKIPPPVLFKVFYDKDYSWDTSHFYGMSLCSVYELCLKHGYKLLELEDEGTNIFLGRADIYTDALDLKPEDIYDINDVMKHSWNTNTRHFHGIPPEQAIIEINKMFTAHKNKYEIGILDK